MTTKEQERKALEQIRQIVEDLGEDSYIGMALEGCLEDAEANIRDDAAYSMNGRWQDAEQKVEHLTAENDELRRQLEDARRQLEREQEWKPYEDRHNVSQADYDKLAACGAKELTDDEAADMIASEFGFDRSKIEIIHEVSTHEVNRHGQLRRTGTVQRKALFEAWDWNYIRFNVRGNVTSCYEMHDDEIQKYWE